LSSKIRESLSAFSKSLRSNVWNLIKLTMLSCIFITALLIRITPTKWGFYLTEFDPYFQYYMTKWIVSHGWTGFVEWFNWREPVRLFWYPYGRHVASSALPGVAFLGAFTYLLLNTLGINIPLLNLCVLLPAFMGALATIFVFLLGREICSDEAGLLAALLLAINYSFISRSIAGFYDDESVAIPIIILSLFAYTRALKGTRYYVLWATISGLCLGYVAMTWGAYIYVANVLALHAILLFFIGKGDRNLSRSYMLLFVTSTIIIALTPKWGINYIRRLTYLVPWVALASSLLYEVETSVSPGLSKRIWHYYVGFISALVLGGVILLILGKAGGISGRYLSVLNPLLRSKIPLVESVGEHRISTWSSLFYEFQTTLFLGILGLYFTIKRRTKLDLLMFTYGITALYAAASMARLTLLMAPAFSVLAGMGFSYMLEPIRAALRRELPIIKRRRRVTGSVGPLQGALALSILLIFVAVPIFSPYISYIANSPALILSASLPLAGDYRYTYTDWLSTLEWIRNNLPKDAVIASWWDYGYWISVMTNRSSVCDNATLNATQIKQVALAFLSNETVALKIFKRLGVKYVVVFEPFQGIQLGRGYGIYFPDPRGYGDFGKSLWMSRIAGLNVSRYIAYSRLNFGGRSFTLITPANTTEATHAVLYRMLFTVPSRKGMFIFEFDKAFLKQYLNIDWDGSSVSLPELKFFKLVFESKPNGYVLVYKVLYNETSTPEG